MNGWIKGLFYKEEKKGEIWVELLKKVAFCMVRKSCKTIKKKKVSVDHE